MTSQDYTFSFVTKANLPLLQRWLQTPEVMRWWGDPDEQFALLSNDLNDPRMAMRIVAFKGQNFAYIQDYDVHAWPQSFLAHMPKGTRGIDQFIGIPEMIGVGHGSTFVRLLAEQLCAEGAPLVMTDPDPENFRARHAYKKAGFMGDDQIDTQDGPTILMTFKI